MKLNSRYELSKKKQALPSCAGGFSGNSTCPGQPDYEGVQVPRNLVPVATALVELDDSTLAGKKCPVPASKGA